MNILEAEVFFKKYGGHGFHMYREDPPRYSEYKNLNIDPRIEERWRQELIQSYFEQFFSEPEYVWVKHSRLVELIADTKTKIEDNCRNLLQYMERMDSLDKRQKILIIENMAGRNSQRKDGGCYYICSRTSLSEEMNKVMGKFMDFQCYPHDNLDTHGWRNTSGRFSEAVTTYKQAYERFKR